MSPAVHTKSAPVRGLNDGRVSLEPIPYTSVPWIQPKASANAG